MPLCECYPINWYDFIVPTNYLVYKLCYRSDKTKIFLVTMIRIIIFITIFALLLSFDKIAYKSSFPTKIFLYWSILIYILINFVSLVLVVFKQNLLDEKEITEEVTKIARKEINKYNIVVSEDHSYTLF